MHHENDVRLAAVVSRELRVIPPFRRELRVERQPRHRAKSLSAVDVRQHRIECIKPAATLRHSMIDQRCCSVAVRRVRVLEHRDDVVAIERNAGTCVRRGERPHPRAFFGAVERDRGAA